MSRRNLKGGAGSARSKEVSTIPMQVDLRVHDDVALGEIELYAEVLATVAASDGPLSKSELDEALGPQGLAAVRWPSAQGWRYIASVDQRLKPSAVYIRTAAVLSSST